MNSAKRDTLWAKLTRVRGCWLGSEARAVHSFDWMYSLPNEKRQPRLEPVGVRLAWVRGQICPRDVECADGPWERRPAPFRAHWVAQLLRCTEKSLPNACCFEERVSCLEGERIEARVASAGEQRAGDYVTRSAGECWECCRCNNFESAWKRRDGLVSTGAIIRFDNQLSAMWLKQIRWFGEIHE